MEVRMKQTNLKKLLISGAAALGIMGLSTPAAFAWSGNSGYGGYNSNSYSNKSNSSCHRKSNYSSDMYGNRRMMYSSYGKMYENNNRYGGGYNKSMNSSYSASYAFAASFSSSNSSSYNRW
jgi:hypothetical protein